MKSSLKPLFFIFLICSLLVSATWGAIPRTASANPVPLNLLANPGFELTVGGVPEDWNVIGNVWGSGIQAASDSAYTGDYGLSIQTSSSNMPWVSQMVPIDEEATYAFHSWFKAVGVNGNVGYKIEYYSGPEGTPANYVDQFTFYANPADLDGLWHELLFEQTAPVGATHVLVYLRLYGTGQVHFDDATVAKTKDKQQMFVHTDHVYYYPDLTSGQINISLEPLDGIFVGKTVDVKITDAEEGNLLEQIGIAASASLQLNFDPREMELLQPYQLQVVWRDALGEAIETVEKALYRWERPTALPQNGPVLVDNEPFFPVIAYHAEISDYPDLAAIGVNTVQGYNSTNLESIQHRLDSAHAHGLKVLVPLYNGMKVKENFELTANIVTRFKDHPAVLGYMIMDEPAYNGIPPQELLDAYKLVRSLDPDHITYIVEANTEAYLETGQATDVLVTDVYPLTRNNMLPLSRVGEGVREAIDAVNDVKPVWTVLQTVRLPFDESGYTPSMTEIRNMAYQAFLSGSKGLGYYALNDPGWRLKDTELWPGFVAFKEELELMGELVKDGTRISQHYGDPIQSGVWQLGSEQVIVVLNTSKDEETATVSLEQIGNQIELLHGAIPAQLDNWESTLEVELGPEQALVYRVRPFAASVDAAIGLWLSAPELIENQYWQARAAQLLGRMEQLGQELELSAPSKQQVLDQALDLICRLEQMELWVQGRSDIELEGKQALLLAVIEDVRQLVLPIMQSAVRLDLAVSTQHAAPGDTWEIAVKASNNSTRKLQDVKLTVSLPDEWELPTAVQPIGKLNTVGSATYTASFKVPDELPGGVYPVTVLAEYKYKNMLVITEQQRFIRTSSLFEVSHVESRLELFESGPHPFEATLTNNVNRTITVELSTLSPGESEIGYKIDSPVVLAPYETKSVQGEVMIPEEPMRGIFTASIEAKAGGTVVASLPLTLDVDTYLVYNGGFEKQAAGTNRPDGWYMRAAVWDKETVHSGQASVRLNPDANNSFNVFESNYSRADGSLMIPVTPGRAYILTGWIKNSAAIGSAALGVRQVDANQISVVYNWFEVGPDSDWTKVTGSFVPLSQTTAVQVYFKLDQLADGAAWLDDVELVEAPLLTEVTAGPLAAGQPVTAKSTSSGSIYLVPSVTEATYAAVEAAGMSASGRIVAAVRNTTAHLDTTGLPTGLYTVYVVDAQGHISAGSARIAIVDPLTQPAKIDNEDAIVSYSGNWLRDMNALSFGASNERTGQQGAYVDIPFYGSGATVVTNINSVYGKANIYVDSVYETTVDYYYSMLQYQQPVFQTGTLTEGMHWIRIEATGESNPATHGTWITFDALEVW
ncbi:carbohydrate binding domain-containing protein [Paenibacillus sp. J5C_2022]|uniref:COG1470 family protein n=1 Tax=Paenibacillus sp. J5C2022 TaxID=2977129 RepID=UPI0021D17600|nr:carbohydrate binding domain-containing protein [Paenibacillus sp. J5C2022]MCU6710829.1 carbohydrate binding domain-containing protein [Paenibacillus sp. J5C2022]